MEIITSKILALGIIVFILGWMAGRWPLWSKGYDDGFKAGKERLLKRIDSEIGGLK